MGSLLSSARTWRYSGLPGKSYTSARCNLYLRDQLADGGRWGLKRQRFYAALIEHALTDKTSRAAVETRMAGCLETVGPEDPESLGHVMLDFLLKKQRSMVMGMVSALARKYNQQSVGRFCGYHVVNIIFGLYLDGGVVEPSAPYLEKWR